MPQQHAEPDGLRRPGVTSQVGQQVHLEAQRHQARDVGADAEEGDVAEAQLAGVAEQQIEAHGGDDEDAGHDQHVQDVEVVQPQRHGDQEQQPGDGEARASPDPLLLREQSRRLEEQDDDDEQEAHARRDSRRRRSRRPAPP